MPLRYLKVLLRIDFGAHVDWGGDLAVDDVSLRSSPGSRGPDTREAETRDRPADPKDDRRGKIRSSLERAVARLALRWTPLLAHVRVIFALLPPNPSRLSSPLKT